MVKIRDYHEDDVASTVYAVPFYRAIGYKRSTGLRRGHSFEGQGLPVQSMRKVLSIGSTTF